MRNGGCADSQVLARGKRPYPRNPLDFSTFGIVTIREREWTFMPTYRIYWFGQNNHDSGADYLIGDADDDVRAGAASYLGMASAVEVWHRARRVVRVSADKPAT